MKYNSSYTSKLMRFAVIFIVYEVSEERFLIRFGHIVQIF